MAKYQLNTLNDGVVDTTRNAHIPNSMDNRDWIAYQQWLTDGGVPDPAPAPIPPTASDLLSMSDIQMIRAIDWLLEQLVQQGTIQLTDVPQQLKDLYVERKAQREEVAGSPQV